MSKTIENLDYKIDESLTIEEQAEQFHEYVMIAIAAVFSLINDLSLNAKQAAKAYIADLANESDENIRLHNGAFIVNSVAKLMNNGNIEIDTGWTFIRRKYTESDLDRIFSIIERQTGERHPLRSTAEEERRPINGMIFKAAPDVSTDEGLLEMLVTDYGYSEEEAKEKIPELRKAVKENRNNEDDTPGVFTVGKNKKRVLNLQHEDGMREYLSEIQGLSDSVIEEILHDCIATVKKIDEEQKAKISC